MIRDGLTLGGAGDAEDDDVVEGAAMCVFDADGDDVGSHSAWYAQ